MSNNKGLTAFVVDDTPMALETLANDLRRQPEFEKVYTYTNYTDATLPLLELQPEVLFLDVEVPGKTGLEFLQSIRPRVNFTFKVVFYSGFSDYMLDAIRQSPLTFCLNLISKANCVRLSIVSYKIWRAIRRCATSSLKTCPTR